MEEQIKKFRVVEGMRGGPKNTPYSPRSVSLAFVCGEEARMLVFKMYGEFHSTTKIAEEIKKRYNYKLGTDTVNDMVTTKSGSMYVKSFRDEFLAKIQEVPISNKKVRLLDYDKNLNILNGMIDELSKKVKKTNSERFALVRLISHSTSLKAEIREEMEKKQLLLQNVNLSMGGVTDEQLQRRKRELLESIKRAEGRGATGAAPDTDDVIAEAEVEST